MATESIRERILQHLEATLATINGTGDYWTDVALVERGQLPPSNLDTLPMIRLSEGEEETIDGPLPYVTRMLPVIARGWLSVTDDDPASLPTLLNRLRADIERALLANPTCGGLALDVIPAGSLLNDDEDKDVTGSVSVSVSIHFRTLRTNPAQ